MSEDAPVCFVCNGSLIGGAILAMDWRTNEQRIFCSYLHRLEWREAESLRFRQPAMDRELLGRESRP